MKNFKVFFPLAVVLAIAMTACTGQKPATPTPVATESVVTTSVPTVVPTPAPTPMPFSVFSGQTTLGGGLPPIVAGKSEGAETEQTKEGAPGQTETGQTGIQGSESGAILANVENLEATRADIAFTVDPASRITKLSFQVYGLKDSGENQWTVEVTDFSKPHRLIDLVPEKSYMLQVSGANSEGVVRGVTTLNFKTPAHSEGGPSWAVKALVGIGGAGLILGGYFLIKSRQSSRRRPPPAPLAGTGR